MAASIFYVHHYDVRGAVEKCEVSTEQWCVEFHKTALNAAADPKFMCCPCCKKNFDIYAYCGEKFQFKGELEGTVRVLAENAAVQTK